MHSPLPMITKPEYNTQIILPSISYEETEVIMGHLSADKGISFDGMSDSAFLQMWEMDRGHL